MKSLVITLALTFLFTGSIVQASEYPLINTDEFSCERLQQMLMTYGTLSIVQSLGGSRDYYLSDGTCGPRKWANPAYVGSADKWFCRLGFVCERRP